MNRKYRTERKRRVQIDLLGTALQELDELVAKLGARSRSQVIRNALAALKWVYRKRVEQGMDIVAIGKDQRVFEPEFTFLPESRGVKSEAHSSGEEEAA
jgi:hypothetical protein